VGYASRSSGLLHVEASWARVFQSVIKTGGGTTQMMHVTSSRRLRRFEFEYRHVDMMDCVAPYYPYFTSFIVL
jgi:hypothetical protein